MVRPSLSVIVPAFNEQELISECLHALFDQDEPVDEIVVVDNNSTDRTLAAVQKAAAGDQSVRVVRASDQGVINARSEGFDSATGQVMARVDADTRVDVTWARAVRDFFETFGDHFDAGSGMCWAYDLPFQGPFRRQQGRIAAETTRALGEGDMSAAEIGRLFGSNMAITRDAWLRVRGARSRRTDVFEDLDLTLTLLAEGCSIGLIPEASASISGRRYLSPPAAYLRYCWRDQRTLRARGLRSAARRAVLRTVFVQMPFYFAMWLPFRAFDPSTGRMRVNRLLRRSPQRVLPSGE
ncbi:Glycosyl transferase family 2 [Williamsia serinedens]|uniref:Glycosyl transferase family 2 n=1 Tax=Williamsia serinedens TaxID=391736 RepID=A0ABT1H0V7_9NOCA|nr:Glycosyl transferase family 2 [Williamsia serinedens]